MGKRFDKFEGGWYKYQRHKKIYPSPYNFFSHGRGIVHTHRRGKVHMHRRGTVFFHLSRYCILLPYFYGVYA